MNVVANVYISFFSDRFRSGVSTISTMYGAANLNAYAEKVAEKGNDTVVADDHSSSLFSHN